MTRDVLEPRWRISILNQVLVLLTCSDHFEEQCFYSGFLPNAAPTNQPGALQACEGRVSGQQMVNRQEVPAWRRKSGKGWVHQFHAKRAKCVNILLLLFFKVIINILFHIFYLYLWGFFSLPCSTIIQTVVRIHSYTCLLQFYALISGHPRGEVGVTLSDIRVHGAGFDNFCYQFLSRDAQIVSLLHICNKIPLGRASGIYNTHQATDMCCHCQQWLWTTDSNIEGMFK